MALATPLIRQEIYYPESDGKPMAETLQHIFVIAYLLEALRDYFRALPDVYVGANNMIYYEKGNPSAAFAPDVYLIRGLDKKPRRVYRLWIEKRVPEVIFEITSRTTWMDDLGSKRVLYAKLGVGEYFIYDVEGEELDPPLQGFRLRGREYLPIPLDDKERLWSEQLGLGVFLEGAAIRLWDPKTNQRVRTPQESYQATREAEEQAREAEEQAREAEEQAARAKLLAEHEHRARLAADQENTRLRAEIAKLRGEQD